MRRKAKDNILMIILGIAFFLNIITINLFPVILEELAVVGYTILGIGVIRLLQRRLPTHEDCVNFENGLCKLDNASVNSERTACPRFTRRNKKKNRNH